MSRRTRLALWLGAQVAGMPAGQFAARLNDGARISNAAVSTRVDDGPGWRALSSRPHERDAADIAALYADTLEAWRKNPIAKRITDITSDYVLGDGLHISSPFAPLDGFVQQFWHHRQNHMDLRLPVMVEELSRAGDLFPILFRNNADGMSYIRFSTKDQISEIATAENDWENELGYREMQPGRPGESRFWRSPSHPEAERAEAVMLHYAVNQPLGALLGESDLATLVPWLLRYSRMLEDRVRLNWAVRAFLWIVTVPSNKVAAKQEQYRQPPEAGSIVVKDEAEQWEVVTPSLRAADARYDLTAVRRMIDAGSGFPPHWRGEPENATLATAEAMQAPAERHLKRRQLQTVYMLEDILFHAYHRARGIAGLPALPSGDYAQLFTVNLPDITRTDNRELAQSARELAQAYQTMLGTAGSRAPTLSRLFVQQIWKIMGEPLPDGVLDQIATELNGE